jgi:hypothetical protein
MKDEFLSALQKEPSPEFAQSLRDHLERRPLRRRRFLWVGGAVALLAIAAAGAWQWTRPHYEQVGEIWVHIVPAPFSPALSPLETARLMAEGGIEAFPGAPVHVLERPVVEFLYVEPALSPVGIPEARRRFDDRFAEELLVPTWVPEGFTGGDEALFLGDPLQVSQWADASIEWTNGEGYSITLLVRSLIEWNFARQAMAETPAFVMFSVPPGGFEEVEVQGHAAVLVEEFWGYAGSWPNDVRNEVYEGLMLFWTEGSTLYWLQGPRDLVTADDLIRMADSAE